VTDGQINITEYNALRIATNG